MISESEAVSFLCLGFIRSNGGRGQHVLYKRRGGGM